jgi:competence protein ComEA
MATQGERRALFFLAAVAILGAGARACRARRVSVDTTGLANQIEAVDSIKSRPRTAGRGLRQEPAAGSPLPAARVDLDVATADEIEKLPGIGPSLARRVVQDRDANGQFGCLRALDRVKGVGPGLLARLDSLVTFSAAGVAPCVSPGRPPGGLQRQ